MLRCFSAVRVSLLFLADAWLRCTNAKSKHYLKKPFTNFPFRGIINMKKFVSAYGGAEDRLPAINAGRRAYALFKL